MVCVHKRGKDFQILHAAKIQKHTPSAEICPWQGLIFSQNLLGKIKQTPKRCLVGLKQAKGMTKTGSSLLS